MKNRYLIVIALLSVLLMCIQSPSPTGEFIRGCINFSSSHEGTVLFGNSEDASPGHPLYKDPDATVIWFLPADDEYYGMMQVGWYFEGTRISYQGGMNEYGLCYDSTAIPDVELNAHPEKQFNPSNSYKWRDLIGKCRNVDEATEFIMNYDFGYMGYQIFLTDSTGKAVIVSPDLSGEISFSSVSNGSYLAQTNFNRTDPKSNYGGYPCKRYDKCCEMLESISGAPDIASFTEILDAVCQKGIGSYTPYSNIFDPVNKTACIFYAGQFNEPVKFNLTEELSKEKHEYKLAGFISDDIHENGLEYHSAQLRKTTLVKILTSAGIILIIATITAGFILIKRKKRKA